MSFGMTIWEMPLHGSVLGSGCLEMRVKYHC